MIVFDSNQTFPTYYGLKSGIIKGSRNNMENVKREEVKKGYEEEGVKGERERRGRGRKR